MATTNLQVASNDSDAQQRDNNTSHQSGLNYSEVRNNSTDSIRTNTGHRFVSNGGEFTNGDTIDSADIDVYVHTASYDDPEFDIYGEPTLNPGEFVNNGTGCSTRAHTTATVEWDATATGTGWKTIPNDAKALLQEIIDQGSWAAGNAFVFIFEARATSTRRCRTTSHNNNPARALKLAVTYTPSGPSGIVPHRRRIEGY